MEVMRRPRLYADRKWLEGYAGCAERLAGRVVSDRGGLRSLPCDAELDARWRLFNVLIYKPTLTARECGEADALLDAFGC